MLWCLPSILVTSLIFLFCTTLGIVDLSNKIRQVGSTSPLCIDVDFFIDKMARLFLPCINREIDQLLVYRWLSFQLSVHPLHSRKTMRFECIVTTSSHHCRRNHKSRRNTWHGYLPGTGAHGHESILPPSGKKCPVRGGFRFLRSARRPDPVCNCYQ